MLYILFWLLTIIYNFKKFYQERDELLSSLSCAQNSSHREMILGHHFYVFIFELFLSFIVAHLITEKTAAIGIIGLGTVYLFLVVIGFQIYRLFIHYLESKTNIQLYHAFKKHLIKELRVNFAVFLLPVLIYSSINWALQDGVGEDQSLWDIVALFAHIIFVSVLTIICTVIIMLRLIPNREISEKEYLDIINKRLKQIGRPNLRIRWIETDIKNAFVVGLKFFTFSNQTLFIGKSLRTLLTLDEFDAVVCHELGHVVNRHQHKRVLDLVKNILSILFGFFGIFLFFVLLRFIYLGDLFEEPSGYIGTIIMLSSIGWIIFNYSLLFDSIRSHEYEADGYAVIVLGVDLKFLKSALEKITTTDELPEYLKNKTKETRSRGAVSSYLSRVFSTHPDLESRLSFLEFKISNGLPFDYYISPSQKIKNWIWALFDWRISIPITAIFIIFGFVGFYNFYEGTKLITFIEHASSSEIMKRNEIQTKLDKNPWPIPNTLYYYIVKKKDKDLIDFYISKGASRLKTLAYLVELKEQGLWEKYYSKYGSELSDKEFNFLIRKSINSNFSEGYQQLVKSQRFEKMDPIYKSKILNAFEEQVSRMPASVEFKVEKKGTPKGAR